MTSNFCQWVREALGTKQQEPQAQGEKAGSPSDFLIDPGGSHSDHFLDKGLCKERRSNAGRKRIDPLILFKDARFSAAL